MEDALEEHRRKTEGKTVTWVAGGELVENADGDIIDVEPIYSGIEEDGVIQAGWSE